MKINHQRKAISQSMDLFIIIAAVLAVGGVVTAAVYSLAGSASTNSSIQVVSVSLTGGASSSASPVAFAITIKNTGSSAITCAPTTCLVTFAGASVSTAAPTCPAATCSIISSPSGWVVMTATSGPLNFNGGSMTVAAGAQTTLVLTGALTTATFAGMPVHNSGTAQTINIVFGTASASTTVLP